MDLVFEIFSEEIPARMQANARKSLTELAQKAFKNSDIEFKSLNSFVSPRRLVLITENLQFSKALAEKFVYKKGPNCNDNPAKLDEFKNSLQGQNFNLVTKDIKNEKYFFAKLTKPKETPEILIKRILERIITEFPWSKSMRWDETNVTWVRPIRNLLCILDGKIIPVQYGKLIANNISYGHRFLAPNSFTVHSTNDYFTNLKNNKVILDTDKRKLKIKKDIIDKLDKLNVSLVEDENLLEEVAGLIEYPFILLGEIDKKFLRLPKEIIISTLKKHQKYFTVQDKTGKLAPYFIVISNIKTPQNSQQIIMGNQKVLQARLADAEFFFAEDTETTLASKMKDLKKIIFHDKFGTIFDKVCSMEKIVEKILDFSQIKFNLAFAKRSVELSKADLTTNLVKELPELQGIIGKYYAKQDGENKIVAQTIAEHYLPKGKEDIFPTTNEGAIVAIADKITTLVILFAVGEIPTSSKDPYSLRRQAVGIIKLLCHFKIHLNISDLVNYTLSLIKKDNPETSKVITEFLFNRFKFYLKDRFKQNLIEAVLATSSNDFYAALNKLHCLDRFINSKEGYKTFLSIKRILNILDQTDKFSATLNDTLFNETEKILYDTLIKTQSQIKPMLTQNDYDSVLQIFTKLAKTIDIFFDKTLIMDKDIKIRKNRLELLKEVEKCFTIFADFSYID